MNAILKKVRNQFSNELATDGDVWRIFRKGTLVDLIKVINELEIDSYADDVFEDIIGITHNILQDE